MPEFQQYISGLRQVNARLLLRLLPLLPRFAVRQILPRHAAFHSCSLLGYTGYAVRDYPKPAKIFGRNPAHREEKQAHPAGD